MRQDPATGGVDSKCRQRHRLLAGMLAAVNDDGYTDATVANVIARSGVSRATFYEHFTDKDDCFLALYRDTWGRLLERIACVVKASAPERALDAVVRQLTAHAEAEPAQAQFLAQDALAGGPRVLDERGHNIGQISKLVQGARVLAPSQTPSPDLPTQAVVGATHWLISQRLRRGEQKLTQLTQELTGWLESYQHPIGKHRWSALEPGPQPKPFPCLAALLEQFGGPALLIRPGLRRGRLAQSRHCRILLATVESAGQAGYAGATVTGITARARIPKRVFYEHFRDKRHAFLVLHELAFQQTVAVGGAAYFSAQQWAERVWRCVLATSQLLATHPAIAHVGLIETHALGLPAIQRVDESRHAFATLVRADGPNTNLRPEETAVEAIAAAIFEIAHDRARHKRAGDLPRYSYHATYLALAPFLGVRAANRFVQRKLKDAEGG